MNIEEMSVNAIRVLSADAIQKANSGHPGLPLGTAPVAYELFAKHMNYNPHNPDWVNRDRFVLSGGHGSMLLYSLFHLFGIGNLSLEEVKNFRQFGSLTPGHPEYGHTVGVEATTGPLGQGMAMAVGIDSVSGVTRFTFGNIRLYNGIKMLAVLLGVYAIAQMIGRINKTEAAVVSNLKAADKDDHITKEDVKKTLPIMTKSSLIGAFIGAVPGTGGAIASFIAYNEAKRKAKPGEKFGEGEIKGIAAPESANNGATAATLIPLLTLGIPGDVVAATLLGAFTMHGLVVGPKLFETSGPIVYAVLIGCVIAQLIMFFQGKYLLGLFVKITHIPQELLTALLVVICCAGAFAIGSSEMDVYVMLLFGVIAYFMQKLDFPSVPIVLGMVLGPIAESNLRNALVMSNGSWTIFVKRPICLAFIILTFVLIVLLKKGDAKQRKATDKYMKGEQEE